jgi:hypothetical protein
LLRKNNKNEETHKQNGSSLTARKTNSFAKIQENVNRRLANNEEEEEEEKKKETQET